ADLKGSISPQQQGVHGKPSRTAGVSQGPSRSAGRAETESASLPAIGAAGRQTDAEGSNRGKTRAKTVMRFARVRGGSGDRPSCFCVVSILGSLTEAS